jgi:hypothetical protein
LRPWLSGPQVSFGRHNQPYEPCSRSDAKTPRPVPSFQHKVWSTEVRPVYTYQ